MAAAEEEGQEAPDFIFRTKILQLDLRRVRHALYFLLRYVGVHS